MNLSSYFRWPGSTHDQIIFDFSHICFRLESGEFGNGFLLGDSGYGIKNYLLTPLLNPRTDGEKNYNNAFKSARQSVIECLFGKWKRRFPILHNGKIKITKTFNYVH